MSILRCLLSFFFFFPASPSLNICAILPSDSSARLTGGAETQEGGEEAGSETVAFQVMIRRRQGLWVMRLSGGGVDAVASLVMSRCQGERAQSKIHVTGRDAVAAIPTRLSVAFFFFVGDSCRLTLLTAAPARKTSVFVAASHLPAAFYFLTNTNTITVGDFFLLLFSSSTG